MAPCPRATHPKSRRARNWSHGIAWTRLRAGARSCGVDHGAGPGMRRETGASIALKGPPANNGATAEAEARRMALVRDLARVALGDTAAMARVYAATSPKLNALLLRMLRDPSEAEEALQDVYLAVWRRAAVFDWRGRVRLLGSSRSRAIAPSTASGPTELAAGGRSKAVLTGGRIPIGLRHKWSAWSASTRTGALNCASSRSMSVRDAPSGRRFSTV